MFLTTSDIITHIYPGISDAISRGDITILESALQSAEAEAKGYLSRFRVESLFGAAGSARDPILLLHVKNIAKWHFIALANPEIDYDDAQLRYEQAIEWLRNIQRGMITPSGWPAALQPEHADDLVRINSNPKRRNHY